VGPPSLGLLQAVELGSLSVAAACQAVLLVSAGARFVSAAPQPLQGTPGDRAPHVRQQQQPQLLPRAWQLVRTDAGGTHAIIESAVAAAAPSLQSAALLVALMCGVALRQLAPPQ
jgi:hypothetical protein